MHNMCVQNVHKLWMNASKTCVRLSTGCVAHVTWVYTPRVQPALIHQFFQVFPLLLSTYEFAVSPLEKSHLYPQSTPPTINPTK